MKTVAEAEAQIRDIDKRRAALNEEMLRAQQELEVARAAERFVDISAADQKAFRDRVLAQRKAAEEERIKQAAETEAKVQERLASKRKARDEAAAKATERVAKPKTEKPAEPADGGEG